MFIWRFCSTASRQQLASGRVSALFTFSSSCSPFFLFFFFSFAFFLFYLSFLSPFVIPPFSLPFSSSPRSTPLQSSLPLCPPPTPSRSFGHPSLGAPSASPAAEAPRDPQPRRPEARGRPLNPPRKSCINSSSCELTREI